MLSAITNIIDPKYNQEKLFVFDFFDNVYICTRKKTSHCFTNKLIKREKFFGYKIPGLKKSTSLQEQRLFMDSSLGNGAMGTEPMMCDSKRDLIANDVPSESVYNYRTVLLKANIYKILAQEYRLFFYVF